MKSIKLQQRKRFEGFDYAKGQTLAMSGREWHQYAKVEEFRISRDRDNRDATSGRGHEVWGVK
jgi:hypothetical protein